MENDEFKAKDRWEDELLVVLEFDKDDEILFEIQSEDDNKACSVFLNSDQVKELITNLEIALNKRQGAKPDESV